MQLQGRSLERGVTGADVSLLHFELKLIGYPPPEEEVAANVFGPGTQQAVRSFQAEYGPKQSGVVDQATAKVINAQVAKLSVADVLARLGEEITRYQVQIDQFHQGSANLEKEVTQLRAALDAMQMACDQVKAEAAASAAHVAGLQQTLGAAQARIGELELALATAQARIAELEKLIDDSNGGKTDSFVVRGLVLRSDTQPMVDATVQAMHADEAQKFFLNSGKTNTYGRYEIAYTVENLVPLGKKKANLFVQVLGPNQSVLVASTVRPEAGPVEVIDLEVKVAEEPKDGFVVQGHVRQADGAPLAGLTVVAWDVDLPSLGQNEQLGRQTTGEDGAYRIVYAAEQFSRAEKAAADLQVRVYPLDTPIDDNTPPLAESETRFNAQPQETIDLVVTGAAYRGLSEFERLLAAIAPLREQVAVAVLSDEDVDFLAGETGENPLYLELLAAAHGHAGDVDQQVDAAPFYGLMREGLPAELTTLLAQSQEVHRDALKRAVAENIIPAALGGEVDAIAAALQALRVRTMLQPPGAQGPSKLSAILSTALPAQEQQAAFLSRYHAHHGDIETFWQELPQHPGFEGDGVVPRLQYTLQLNVLTGGHAPLIQAIAADGNLQSTRALIDLDAAAWQARITATGADGIAQIPATIKGDTDAEKVANYAGSIVETLKAAFPSEYLAKAIAVTPDIDLVRVRQVRELNPDLSFDLRRPLPADLNWGQMAEGDRQKAQEAIAVLRAELNAFPQLEAGEVLNAQWPGFDNWIRAGVQTFLAQAGDFDFGKSNIDAYLQEKGYAAFGDMTETQREKVTEQLKAFQRVFQVVPRDDSIMALMGAGLLSGMAIANVPVEVFTDGFAAKVGGKLHARLIHENARDLRDRATLALGSAIQYTSEIYPRAVWAPKDDDDEPAVSALAANGGAARRGPSRDRVRRPVVSKEVQSLYATLFGKLNLCQCEHCRSVYSPAAYLVDLLHFLDREDLASPTPRRRPLDVLLARRPDLEHIALTCENTHTELPYVDLVNEALESYVVLGTPHDSSISGDRRLRTSAELLANPQHVNTEAYTRLKDAVYPMTLPFDRDLEVVRAYLAQLGVSRSEVMKALQTSDPRDDAAATGLSLEYLNLAPGELRAFPSSVDPGGVEPPPSDVWRMYGFDAGASADWIDRLTVVETFLERTQTTYDDLLELLKTRFINPGGVDAPTSIVIAVRGDGCDLADRILHHRDGSPLRDAEWDALQRLIRLWRRLGWSIHDVDRALAAFAIRKAGRVDAAFLTRLGQAVQVRDQLDLGLAETLSLWGKIDTHDIDPEKRPNDSLYARLFLNPAVRALAGDSDPFAINRTGTELDNTTRTLANLAPAVLAALRLTAADLPFLLSLAGLAEDARVNLANLSTLHRYAVLARALRIRVNDLATLRDFIGPDPFADPATTLTFVKRARKLAASRFSPSQLAYLYWHVSDPARPLSPQPAVIAARLCAIRAGLSKLADDLAQGEPLETRLRKGLGQLMDQARIDAVMRLLDRSQVYATRLEADPGLAFPDDDPLHGRIVYDAPELRIVGPVTEAEQRRLLGMSTADGYDAAIRALHTQARTFVERELGQFALPDEAVERLIDAPSDLDARQAFVLDRVLAYLANSQIAQTFAEAFGLDVALAHRLLTSVRRSHGGTGHPLLEDFLALRDGALDAVYSGTGAPVSRVDPTPDFANRHAWPDPVLVGDGFSVNWAGKLVAPRTDDYTLIVRAGGTVTLSVNGVVRITGRAGHDPDLRVTLPLQGGVVYDLALAYGETTGSRTVQLLWETRATPRGVISQDYLFPALAWKNAWDDYLLLHKAALLVNGFKLTVAELSSLSDSAAGPGSLRLNDLRIAPYDTDFERLAAAPGQFDIWEELYDLFTFRDGLVQPERLPDVLTATSSDAAKARLVAATGWDTQALDDATGPAGFNANLVFFKSGHNLVRLASCLALSRRIGVSPDKLFSWSDAEVDAGQAQEVRDAVKARYEAAEWLAVAKGLNDPLRERQRDALVAYILTRPTDRNPARTSMELFEHFLIDVDMSSCLPTSRIKQAISSVQLFVQRCFMALEPEVSPALLPADQWKWMRNYRVWEANRKVFLYPENWIEPELRDDKSPFFKELENELLQNDLTQDTAEAAFLSYLEKLDEVARLDVRGMYWEHESEVSRWDDENWTNPELDPRDRADILHVFARTQGTPPVYYYRRLVNHKLWTPWEKVQADIEGDHLIPVVYNRRLYLFWPLFRETTDPDQQPPQQGERARRPDKRLEIQLAWSEYRDGKWSAKKVTAQKLMTTRFVPLDTRSGVFFPSPEPWSSFFFDTSSTDGILVMRCNYKLNRTDNALVFIGDFSFEGCENDAVAISVNRDLAIRERGRSSDRLTTPEACFVYGQHFASWGGPTKLKLATHAELGVTGEVLRFRQLPDVSYAFRVVFLHQYTPFELQSPFFYQDNAHTYFVTPDQVADTAQQVASPGQVILIIPPVLVLTSPGSGKRTQGALASSFDTRALATPAAGSGLGASDRVTWDDTLTCIGDQSQPYLMPGTRPEPATQLKLRFHIFSHPYVCEFIKRLKRRSVPGLLALDVQQQTDFSPDGTHPNGNYDNTQFVTHYHPTEFVDLDYPKEDVDFDNGAYAQYNWELFFHVPLLIADRLSKNQRFEQARQWFHYIMDPTTSLTEPAPQRYWNVLPFYNNSLAPRDQIGELLHLLSYRGTDRETLRRKEELEAQIDAWRKDPFNPHHIARMRITAYQKTVVMKYIDNLIAWGDQLFQQDTMESINQATQLYILAYLLLGPRPKLIPPASQPVIQTFHDLRGGRDGLDRFSNALVATENAVAGRRCVPWAPTGPGWNAGSPTLGALYFCIPATEKLLGTWDTVEDRLFKIRHCMNIEGVVRQLPLFEPPIDPALLVRARAAGLDLSRVLNDINAALPHYRFNVMLQKALELCGEVRSLGAALLSALEKRDAEALSLLRSTHEIRLLEAVREVRQKQVDEANEALAGMQKSKEVVETRRNFYRDIVQISPGEKLYMDNLGTAHVFQMIAQGIQASVSAAHMVPHFDVGIAGWAASPIAKASFGGNNLGSALRAAAEILNMIASQYTYKANMASIQAGYDRRWDEWKHQERLANKELEQIDRQVAAARIRHEIAAKEMENHDLQIENARAMDEFMRSKFTNRELYGWMVDQTSALYFQAYQLAYELAKSAERAYQFERGVSTSSFVRFDSWDSLHKGLMAGERLTLDLKRLEKAFMDQNRRDYEITKHVSLVLHAPLALIALKTTGQCEITLPEALFDMDYPGHFMRRLKSVSLTIPAVVGPYTSVNCTLTLQSSRIRKNASRPTDYAESEDDDRFLYNFAPVQSIATSHGQNDSGMFELNFRDERYLPFEGAGAVSTWRIELPPDCNAFDLDTITDVVMRLNYTARDGGDSLRREARTLLGLGDTRLRSDDRRTGEFQRLFSLKHEFAVEWAQFMQAPGAQQMRFNLTRERFPYQLRGRTISVQQFHVFLVPARHAAVLPAAITLARPDGNPVTRTESGTPRSDWPLTPLYDLPHAIPRVDPSLALAENSVWTLGLPEGTRIGVDQLDDILLVCTFGA